MARNRKNKPPTQTTTSSFNEAALSKLTAKIDRSLTATTDDTTHRGKRKRKSVEDLEASPAKKQVPTRDQRGKGKDAEPGQQDGGKTKKESLLEEIIALGGDEDDLELVAGIDSDAEDGADKTTEMPLDNGFTAELAKFASSLGFEKVRQEALDASESESDEASDEGEEDEVSEKNVAAQQEPRAEPAVENPRGRKLGKLVSKDPVLDD